MNDTPEPVIATAVPDESTALARPGADPTGFLSIIREAAVSKTDPATMQGLLDVYKDAQKQRAEEAYAEAIVQFRRGVRPIIMTGHRDDRQSGGQVHYDYAELTTTIEQIQSILDHCQLTPTWRTVKDEPGYVSLECIVTHILKHKESSGPFGSPVGDGRRGQSPVQVRQGVVTSLKRATLFMVLGLTTKEDDRALGETEQGEDKEPPKPPAQDEENQAKKDFWNLARQKAQTKFTADQAKQIFIRVQQSCGKTSAVDCLDWLQKKDVLVAADGTLSVVKDQFTAAPAGASPAPSSGGPDQEPPLSDTSLEDMKTWKYACAECGTPHKVLPSKGRCTVRTCVGQVVPV